MKQEQFEQEIRSKYGDNVELRTSEVRAAGDDSLVIEGYAANFDQATDLGYFWETIARGAFDNVSKMTSGFCSTTTAHRWHARPTAHLS